MKHKVLDGRRGEILEALASIAADVAALEGNVPVGALESIVSKVVALQDTVRYTPTPEQAATAMLLLSLTRQGEVYHEEVVDLLVRNNLLHFDLPGRPLRLTGIGKDIVRKLDRL